MSRYKIALVTLILAALVVLPLLAQAAFHYKPLAFDNPGTKRVLKSAAKGVFFFRSLPEKNLSLNVKDLATVEIRAIAKKKLSKPEFTLTNGKINTTYSLKLLAFSTEYQIYEPISLNLPKGSQTLEITCYDNNIYFRAYSVTPIKKKLPKLALTIGKNTGKVILTKDSEKKEYYTFDKGTPFTFDVTKGHNAEVFLRAQLNKKVAPVVDVYRDGALLSRITLELKRSKTYTCATLLHLTTGKKISLPASNANAHYELRPVTDQVFIARPVILKSK